MRVSHAESRHVLPCLLIAGFLASGVQAAPGDLDPTFGSGGFVRDAMGGNGAAASALVVDAGGHIVVAGSVVQTVLDGEFGVLRLNPGGSPDPTFAGSGRAIVGESTGSDEEGYGLVVQPDGRLVVAGTSFTIPTGNRATAVRLNGDGTIDTGFGNQGTGWFASTRSGDDIGIALAYGGGGFAVGGYVSDGGGGIDAMALRLDSLGMPVPLFGNSGFALAAADSNSANAVVLLADGRVLLGGHLDGDGSSAFVQRFSADGTPDATFAGDGRLELPALSRVGDLLALADGRMLVAGFTNNDAVVLRLLADGAPDASFGSGGMFTLTAASQDVGQMRALALARQPDGRIVAGGNASSFTTGAMGFALRLLDNGTLDAGFANAGVRLIDASTDLRLEALALQADGAIVLAGVDLGSAGSSSDDQFLVVRLEGGAGGEPPRTLSIADATLVEGDAGNALMAFTLTLSSPSPGGIGVTVQSDLGTATPNVDYVPTGALLTFDAGVSSLVFQVPVIGDLDDEDDETFLARLSGAAGAVIGDGVATGTIIDDDAGEPLVVQPLPVDGRFALVVLCMLLAFAARRARCARRLQD